MAWKYQGFLAPRHRKYLSGNYDFGEHSNPSQFRRELRERVAGARKDFALINRADFIGAEELMEAHTNIHDPRHRVQGGVVGAPMTDEAITENKQAAKAQAESVGLEGHDSLEEVLHNMTDEIDGSTEGEMAKSLEEWLVSGVIETMKGMMGGLEGDSDEQEVIEGFIEGGWPDKERALEIARKNLDDG